MSESVNAAEPGLVVSEIYRSVQGESSWVGRPCTFVRLTGCNLRCVWCDSAFAFHGGDRLSLGEIEHRVASLGTHLVEVTGGEPLLQREVHELMRRLLAAGNTVLLETGGSLDLSAVDPRVVKIVDLKCPASGEVDANLWPNLEHLRRPDEVKLVIADRADYEWARSVVGEHELTKRVDVLLGVVHGALAPRRLVEWILEDGLDVRFQLQAHKYIWDAEARGV